MTNEEFEEFPELAQEMAIHLELGKAVRGLCYRSVTVIDVFRALARQLVRNVPNDKRQQVAEYLVDLSSQLQNPDIVREIWITVQKLDTNLN